MNSHDIWTQESTRLISKSKQLREQSARLCAENKHIVSPYCNPSLAEVTHKANR